MEQFVKGVSEDTFCSMNFYQMLQETLVAKN